MVIIISKTNPWSSHFALQALMNFTTFTTDFPQSITKKFLANTNPISNFILAQWKNIQEGAKPKDVLLMGFASWKKKT